MKKKWYDYLWIASLAYLVLGFFNILFAWLGLLCFFIPLLISIVKGTKGYCNRYCGRGQLFSLLGGRFGLSRKRDIPRWIPDLLFRHVFPDALEYLFGFRRRAQPATGGNAAVDIQAALALGVSWHAVSPRRGAVRLWVLQRDAHLHRAGADHHGAVQTPELVRLLPHGYDDPADL